MGEFDIDYKPRGAMKGQVVTDFVVELTPFAEAEDLERKILVEDNGWLLNVDGSSADKASGAKIILISPEGKEVEYAIKFGFKATNNEAEYEALVNGLKIASEPEG